MQSQTAFGWLNFAGGVAALILQIWNGFHGMMPDASHVTMASSLTLGGAAHLASAAKGR